MKSEFKLIKDYGSVGTKPVRGDRCEILLRRVSWDGKPCWDIRAVTEDGKATYKGITMSTPQLIKLRDLLEEIDLLGISDKENEK